jgi:hypothetical protein
MKLKHILFVVTIFAVVSAACNLPFTLRGAATDTATPTLTQVNSPTSTSTPAPSQTPTPTSLILLVPSPTVFVTPFPTGNVGSTQPTVQPSAGIPVTGMGTQTSTNLITFAPTANPQHIFVGSCGTNQTTITVVINQPNIVGSMLLLDRLDQLPDGSTSSFGAATTMKAIDVGKYQATITAPEAKPGKKEFNTVLDYKFAVLDIAGKLVASSFVYNNITVTVCKK